jgi:hypothetical protein
MLTTPEQFKRHFLPHLEGGYRAHLSPHLNMWGKRFGATSGATVIGEFGASHPEHPDTTFYPCKRHFMDCMEGLEDGGLFVGRFPVDFVLRVLTAKNDKTQKYPLEWMNVETLHIDGECVIAVVRKETNKGQTEVHYADGNSITLNLAETPVLLNYNQRHYNYITNFKQDLLPRVIVSGRGGDYNGKLRGVDIDKCIFFYGFGSRPKIVGFDKINTSLSCDFFLTDSAEDVEFYETVVTGDVLDLINNLCYNKLTSLKAAHKHYIINPQIRSL